MRADLTVKKVEQAKPSEKGRKIFDGGGLYLYISPTGHKAFRYAYRFDGKQKDLTLGAFPELSLKDARIMHGKAREALSQGRDPGKKDLFSRPDSGPLFGDLARDFLKARSASVAPLTLLSYGNVIKSHLLPALGDKSAADISPLEIAAVLEGLQEKGEYSTAHKALQLTRQIFRHGFSRGYTELGLTDSTQGLKVILPPSTGFAFIHEPEPLGELLRKIDRLAEARPITGAALQLAPLVFLRTSELVGGTWGEVNFGAKVWIIPEHRMKMKRAHIVPLADQALEILRGLRERSERGEHMFESPRDPRRPLSPKTLQSAIHFLGYTAEELTLHGFRKTASTLLNEAGYNSDWIETQLAHTTGSTVRGIYNKAQFLPGRTAMMQAWADYLFALKRGEAATLKAPGAF